MDNSDINEYRKRAVKELEARIKELTEDLSAETAAVDGLAYAKERTTEKDNESKIDVAARFGKAFARKNVIHSGHRERMREACKRDRELSAFTDIELIEFLLSFFIPQKDTNVTAHRLIDKFGSALGVLCTRSGDIAKIPHVTEQAATLLPLLTYMCVDSGYAKVTLPNRDANADFFMSVFGRDGRGIYAAYLDEKFALITAERLTDSGELRPRTVVTSALEHCARYVFIARRDGALFPDSFALSETVAELGVALRAIGVRLLDYMLFTDYGYYTVGKPAADGEWSPMYAFVPALGFCAAPELFKKLTEHDDPD